LRRVGLSTVRRAALARATFDEVNDPYMVDHIEAKTQEQLEEELGYNKKYPDYTDEYNKHRQHVVFGENLQPFIAQNSFVAPCATLVGMVEVWHEASIWYRVTIKAENKLVRIGYMTNIQDGTVIEEVPEELGPDHDGSVMIGNQVTVGHGCYLRACTIEDNCLIGMGSILNTGSYVEHGSILGAHSVLRPFQRIPHGQVWVGNPARYLRDVSDEELTRIEKGAEKYSQASHEHCDATYLQPMELYREAEEKGYCVGHVESEGVIANLKSIRDKLRSKFSSITKE